MEDLKKTKEDIKKIFIGNAPKGTTPEEIEEFLKQNPSSKDVCNRNEEHAAGALLGLQI